MIVIICIYVCVYIYIYIYTYFHMYMYTIILYYAMLYYAILYDPGLVLRERGPRLQRLAVSPEGAVLTVDFRNFIAFFRAEALAH